MIPLELRSKAGTARKFQHGLCRMCLRPKHVRPLTRHHLVPIAWFRKNPHLWSYASSTANLVPLCRPCHDMIDNRNPADREDARRLLRRSLSQQEIAFAIAVRGRMWLNHHYPP
jgi:5-methylcytosine-specific restriction endonuclease McrA